MKWVAALVLLLFVQDEKDLNPVPGSKGSANKTPEMLEAVDGALKYLSDKQLGPDSGHGSSHEGGWWAGLAYGFTTTASYAGLAYLAAGSTLDKGPYQENLKAVLEFVLRTATKPLHPKASTPTVNWSLENWPLSASGMFLAEMYRIAPEERIKTKLEEVVAKLQNNIQPTGNWGHGEGSKPTHMKYVDLVVMNGWALSAIGMAQRVGIEVDQGVIDRGLEGIRKCSRKGAIVYSVRQKNTPAEPGRTGICMLAFSMCGKKVDPLFDQMAAYLKKSMSKTPRGHGSATMSVAMGALGAKQASEEIWDAYVARIFPAIMGQRDSDGSFRLFKPGSDSPAKGPYPTALLALTLALDEGRLGLLSGAPARGSKSAKKSSPKRRGFGRRKK